MFLSLEENKPKKEFLPVSLVEKPADRNILLALYVRNLRVQHRLCPSRFPRHFSTTSRAPSRPTKRFHPDQHATDIIVSGKLVLKWIEDTLYCFRTKGKYNVNKNLKPAMKCGGSKQGKGFLVKAFLCEASVK